MRSIVAWLFACTSLLLLPGCATFFNRGENMDVRFNSDPEGAKLELASGAGECAATPCVLNLAKRQSYSAKASKPGFNEATYFLKSRITKWTWANFLWLNPIPVVVAFGIDFLTQSFWVLENDQVLIRLEEEGEDEPETEEPEPETTDEPPCAALPVTPLLVSVRERFSDDFIEKQIEFYRGDLSEEQECKTRNVILQNLMKMLKDGERLDIDEAFRREYFQRLGETELK